MKRDKKLDELVKLIDHIAEESSRGEREKVLIFTEYRQTQAAPRRRAGEAATAKAARWSSTAG